MYTYRQEKIGDYKKKITKNMDKAYLKSLDLVFQLFSIRSNIKEIT